MADAKQTGGGELAPRFTTEVQTLAKPSATPLIGARGVVHRSTTLQDTFKKAKAESWSPERLAGAITPELEQALDCEPEAAIEVAQYLADEYFQLGDAVLLCDRTTGRAIARISDNDFYQPPAIAREGGSLVHPPPRLNPNLEGFIVSYVFEEARDAQLRAEITARLPRTEFLTTDLDPRPRALTRAGRVGIAQDVREALPDVLATVQGSARTFLDCFDHVSEPPPSFDPLPRRSATARGRQNIVDRKAMNLRFSWEATIKARTGVGWVREMAAQVVNEARMRIRPDLRLTVAHPLLTREHVQGCRFWFGDPATLRALQTIPAPAGMVPPTWSLFTVLPCLPDFQGAVGINAPWQRVGAVTVHPEGYDFQTREIHGRWEMNARMEYTLYIDWDRVRYIHVTDIPVEAVAEIL